MVCAGNVPESENETTGAIWKRMTRFTFYKSLNHDLAFYMGCIF